jgi:FkbM family methyltransferase
MKLTACLNPAAAARVTVYKYALGEASDECDLLSSATINHGNGVTRCGAGRGKLPRRGLRIVDSITVRRFDEIMAADTRRVNILKIDTEGFELFALRGAETMFQSAARRPHVLYTEFSPYNMGQHSVDPAAYLSLLKRHGLECDAVRGVSEAEYAAYVKSHPRENDLRCDRLL